MSVSTAFYTMRVVLMLAVMCVIWLVLGMVYFDRFIPPFDHLVPWLMPWKGLGSLPFGATLGQRLSIMQGLLDSSNMVANYALLTMIVSFTIFSVYLTLVYQ